jgi:hypothetical protein
MNTYLATNLAAQRVAALSLALIGACAVSACYVVPIHQGNYPPPQAGAVLIAPELPINMAARLYPANEAATPYGMLTANVTNQLNGKGQFSVNVAGELLQGEATRTAGSSRAGTANAAGARGTFMQCSYTMNNATLGSGHCQLNNGAQFSLHIGS